MKENIENIFGNILNRIRRSDRGLWASSVVMMTISLLLMFSTTDILGDPIKNTFTQFVFFFAAYVGMIILHYVHYNYIRKFARYTPYLILFLLLALIFFGVTINGARRWITIPLVGFTFQPSELIKVFLVLYVARTLAVFQTAKKCDDVAFRRIVVVTGLVCFGIAISDIY